MNPFKVGKTHLAASILHELIVRFSVKGFFCNVPEMGQLYGRSTGRLGRIRVHSKQEREIYFRRLETAEVLLLDDLGISAPHRNFGETIDCLLGARYSAMRPVIVTSRFPPFAEREGITSLEERLGVATVSRLRQTCRFFRLVGCDLRSVLGREAAIPA